MRKVLGVALLAVACTLASCTKPEAPVNSETGATDMGVASGVTSVSGAVSTGTAQ